MNAWVRLAAASFLVTIPIRAAAAEHSAAADSLLPPPVEHRFVGHRIDSVEIHAHNIFDPAPGSLSAPLQRLANHLHVPTRAATVRSHLLFREGDAWDPAIGEETARNLRRLQFLQLERLEPVMSGDSLRIVVETRDLWSTLLDFNVERGGGGTYGALSFTERNLLGFGKEVSAGYSEDPTGISRGAYYSDPALGGGRTILRAGGATGSNGASNEFQFGVPFWAQDAPTTSMIEGTRVTSVAHLFERGSEVATFDRRIETLEVTAGYGRRQDGIIRRVTGSFRLFNRRLGPSTIVPGAPSDFAGKEDNLRIRRLSGRLMLWRPDYIRRSYVNEMGTVEDFDVGQAAEIELGVSPKFLGATADEAYLHFGLDAGARNPLGFGRVKIDMEGRVRNTPVEVVRRLDARWTHMWGPRHAMLFSVLGTEGTHVPRDFQVVFGGLNGLRAYSVHALAGRRAWRFNAEDRWTLPQDIGYQLRLGVAGFYDGARAWGPGSAGSEWFHSAGFGVRMSLPRLAPSQILRIDVAWPIEPTRDGRRDPVVSFGSKQAF